MSNERTIAFRVNGREANARPCRRIARFSRRSAISATAR